VIKGDEGLWGALRTGRKRTGQGADIKYVEDCCDREERTYNNKQLSHLLKKERSLELSPERIRKILKKGQKMEKNKNNSESSPTPQTKRSQGSRFRYVTN
jgi:hypothetical protein